MILLPKPPLYPIKYILPPKNATFLSVVLCPLSTFFSVPSLQLSSFGGVWKPSSIPEKPLFLRRMLRGGKVGWSLSKIFQIYKAERTKLDGPWAPQGFHTDLVMTGSESPGQLNSTKVILTPFHHSTSISKANPDLTHQNPEVLADFDVLLWAILEIPRKNSIFTGWRELMREPDLPPKLESKTSSMTRALWPQKCIHWVVSTVPKYQSSKKCGIRVATQPPIKCLPLVFLYLFVGFLVERNDGSPRKNMKQNREASKCLWDNSDNIEIRNRPHKLEAHHLSVGSWGKLFYLTTRLEIIHI